jgi:hypothetical protein
MSLRASCVVIVIAIAGCSSDGPRARTDSGTSTTPVPDGGDGGPRVTPTPFDGGGCFGSETDDLDGDGFTPQAGDCYDCSPQVNPGAFDDPGNAVDEDCDGTIAADFELCDSGLAIDTNDPNDAARAIGLCRFTTEDSREWGVISARWVRADGTGTPASDLQHGVMSGLGPLGARAGSRMLALSSGVARAAGQPGYTDACDELTISPQGGMPSGLNPESPACPGVESGEVYDPVALELRVRVPSNAEGFRFESSFFTYEYPNYICSSYNDFFVVVMEPRPSGSSDGNLVFDADGNKVSVNNSLLRACEPGEFGGRNFDCPLGTASLTGTSYDGTADCGMEGIPGIPWLGGGDHQIGASTGWLRTTSTVDGGTIVTLRFAVWDAGDPTLDSLALIDAFDWLVEDPGTVVTDPILF